MLKNARLGGIEKVQHNFQHIAATARQIIGQAVWVWKVINGKLYVCCIYIGLVRVFAVFITFDVNRRRLEQTETPHVLRELGLRKLG